MKTIQFVKVNNTFIQIETNVNTEHYKNVMVTRAVMTVAKKMGWI